MNDATPQTIVFTGPWQAVQYLDASSADGTFPSAPLAGWFEAQVPGALQYDLVRHGKLENPYASSRAVQAAEWVHKSDWLLRTSFEFDPQSAADQDIVLECDGIDTFADLWLNGQKIGAAANAYRSYRFNIDPALLRKGSNELLVHLKAHMRMVEHMVPEAMKRLGPTFKYKGLIRRYQRSFFAGSSLLNLGGEVLGIGIYKPIRLRFLPKRRIETLHFEARSATTDRAEVAIHVGLAGENTGAGVTATLLDIQSGAVVASSTCEVSDSTATTLFTIEKPKLWWPRGYGAPNRYRLRIELDGGSVEERIVGIRTVKLLTKLPNGRPTFQVVVNGTSIHCRGHNLVPIDYIKVHGSQKTYDQLLHYTVESNSNMLRIWGGGGIEAPAFYDACDAMGIMIWQDFYLHSNTYPDYDPEWVAEFKKESEELLIWLRNHPSLVLLCGGNEQIEGWDEWGWRGQIDRFYGQRLIEELLPEVSARLCPELPYIVNSPHGGNSAQAPQIGEVHNWGNFYNSTKDPLFVTETCWSQQSYSSPQTLKKMMGIDLDAFADIGWPARWKELTGLDLVSRLPYIGGPLPCRTLREYLRALEIEQALADHHALTNLLMRSPNLNGLLYWPLNKGGPLFQFGCVDYLGFPLASYYVIKRLFADVVVTFYRDMTDIRVIAANRSLRPVDGTLRVTHQRLDGSIVREWKNPFRLEAAVHSVRLLDLAGYYETVVDRTAEFMKAQLIVAGAVVTEETLIFAPLMEINARSSSMNATVTRTGSDTWDLELQANALVKLFYAEANQKFLLSDNYFALTPDSPRRIAVKLLERTSEAPAELRICAMDSEEVHVLALK